MEQPMTRNVRFVGGPMDGKSVRVAGFTGLTHLVSPVSDDGRDEFIYTLSRTVAGEWIGAAVPLDTFQLVMPISDSLPFERKEQSREMAIQEWKYALARTGALSVGDPVTKLEDENDPNYFARGRRWRVLGSVLPAV